MLGTWTTGYQPGSTREAANGTYEITAMNMATGALSGTAETLGTHFTLEGVESGSEARITLKDEAIKYIAYDTLPLSVLASGHIGGVGSFNSTGFGTPGTGFWAELTSASSTEEAAKKAKEEAEKEKRPTGTSIICNYEFATSLNTCVASVGDAGTPPSVTPTGTVTFTTTTGAFSSGAQCSLAQVPSSPSVASCSLVYFTTNSGLPSITASYGGDAHHAPSSAQTQYLGLGTEGTFEAPTGPSGQYPNEVGVSTEVPVSGTTVEGAVQGPNSSPSPVPMTLPGVTGLDSVSASDLKLTETLATKVDASGAQNAAALKELDAAMEKLAARSVEVTKGSGASEQAEARVLAKDASATLEAITKMLKEQAEAQKQVLHNAKSSAFSAATKRAGKPRTTRVRSLAYVTLHGVAAGKLKLKLKLNRAALAKLAGKRNSITVYVRVDMILPSGVFKRGVPRSFLQRVTLKRAPKHKK